MGIYGSFLSQKGLAAIFQDFSYSKNTVPIFNINKEEVSLYSGNEINLYDCLNLFNSEEILEGDKLKELNLYQLIKDNEWYCNKCKKHRDVIKKMDIFKSPYYLP